MEELKYHKMRDGSTLSLQEHGGGMKYTVALYDRSDIEQWTQDFHSKEDAYVYFNRKQIEDKRPIDKSGAKR